MRRGWRGTRDDVLKVIDEVKDIEEKGSQQNKVSVHTIEAPGDLHETLDGDIDNVFIDVVSGILRGVDEVTDLLGNKKLRLDCRTLYYDVVSITQLF